MRSLQILVTLSLVGAAGVSYAGAVGLARSPESFSVARGESAASGLVTTSVVQTGDRVVAGSSNVQVQTPNGQTVLVGQNAAVSFPAEQTVSVHQGEVAVAAPANSSMAVQAGELQIVRVGEATEATSSVAVNYEDAQTVTVSGLNGSYAVSTIEGENQVAVVGSGDVVRLVRNPLGNWTPVAPLRAQTDGATQASDESSTSGGSRFLGLSPLALIGIGAGAVVAGSYLGYVAYRNVHDGDPTPAKKPRAAVSETAPAAR